MLHGLILVRLHDFDDGSIDHRATLLRNFVLEFIIAACILNLLLRCALRDELNVQISVFPLQINFNLFGVALELRLAN